MDILERFSSDHEPIQCVEMHTVGEPARIVVRGYPSLEGSTLLEQRTDARANHDHIRKRLLLEPRGHFDMYGAILRQHTQLVDSGEAHIGVLFITNGGYSDMCGHATIALGRFLLDTHDPSIFPKRDHILVDEKTQTAALRLHAPCGIVEVTVPVTADGSRSDPSRLVSFILASSFAAGLNIVVELPLEYRWPELKGRTSVAADFAYGGAFYCMISGKELGFANGLRSPDYAAFNHATRLLKAAVNADPKLRQLFKHPDHEDPGSLYSIVIVDATLGLQIPGSKGAETGLHYFGDQQVDRSPTGTAVAARAAVAYAKGTLKMNESWTYHSIVSNAFSEKSGRNAGFVGTVIAEEGKSTNSNVSTVSFPRVSVKVEGHASYTGFHTFVHEASDVLGEGGFVFDKLGQ